MRRKGTRNGPARLQWSTALRTSPCTGSRTSAPEPCCTPENVCWCCFWKKWSVAVRNYLNCLLQWWRWENHLFVDGAALLLVDSVANLKEEFLVLEGLFFLVFVPFKERLVGLHCLLWRPTKLSPMKRPARSQWCTVPRSLSSTAAPGLCCTPRPKDCQVSTIWHFLLRIIKESICYLFIDCVLDGSALLFLHSVANLKGTYIGLKLFLERSGFN